ncbi:D-alanyl-D-alanine carboxypeptidase [Litoribacter ruber]|nr:D-alanyl-D-alanine carboxypeptidase [Litoribacter ruber]
MEVKTYSKHVHRPRLLSSLYLVPSTITLLLFLQVSSLIAQPSRDKTAELESYFNKDSFFNNHLTGFMLYDLDTQQPVYEKNSHLYFIPASTTKLVTFFSSLITLGDSTTILRYVNKGNEVTVWGTGDPSWKYHALPQQPRLREFFDKYEKINFSDANWKDQAFGFGWQWDDYYFSYSAEKSPFPIYGNVAKVINRNNKPEVSPSLFRQNLTTSDRDVRNVQREFHSNQFYYNPRTYNGMNTYVPFLTSQQTFAQLASSELNKMVIPTKEKLPKDHQRLKGIRTEALYKEMMLESDNFIAEHLLLMISDELFQELNSERAIDYIKKTYLIDLPDELLWVDGSGLSRHNLMTPRSLVVLMDKIYRVMPDEMLFNLLPKGGVSGTLKNNYHAPKPYVFGKTGTISNNHSLVGFVRTKSDKLYAFAFMNNNYPYKASKVRAEMEKVMVYIRENF